MRRADRLFEIIQILRSAPAPITASQLADSLEVSSRTIYRDMAALQARRIPIQGGVGVGYVMRSGYDLPPLMFSIDEIEAIAVGLGLVRRTGDRALLTSADRVARKVALVLPPDKQRVLQDPGLYTSSWGARLPEHVDLAELRCAIREERKLRISYRDQDDQLTHRVVQPIAVVYHVDVVILVAWCELRRDFRHFRVDRICGCAAIPEGFAGCGVDLRADWLVSRKF